MSSKKVFFVSEPYAQAGAVAADVMRESIAASAYSQQETFLRETLQNACDQKPSRTSQIDFIVDAFQVSGKRKELFDDFFSEARLGIDHLKLSNLKDADSFEALVVADVGTIGLVGPIDASIDETPSNFAGFFFNVGRAEDPHSEQGGTFGLGRTTLTNSSRYSTVLVYSQFKANSKMNQRFMGMAISGAFRHGGKKYTGRHWYGQLPKLNSGLVQPFEGSDAEDLARKLGLLNYLGESTGFVAMVIGNSFIENPEKSRLAGDQRLESIKSIQQAACIYGWPHMLGTSKQKSVNFSFRCDGKEIPEKDPTKMPVLSEYIKCYEALSTHIDGVESTEIFFTGGNKNQPTGTLTWLNTPISASDLALAKEQTIPVSSIALMRQANFVVKYLEVTQKVDQIATRGVFKTNKEFDAAFRKSEPAAHDEWLPWKLRLPPRSRNPIKQTLDNIKENFKELAGSRTTILDGSASVVLGNIVGRLLDGLNLTGTPKQQPGAGAGGGAGGGGKTAQMISIGSPKISASNVTHYSAIFKFQVLHPKDIEGTTKIKFNSYAILENGNAEMDPPDGVEVPTIEKISCGGRLYDLDEPITVDESMHLQTIEVMASAPQGIGTTCRWKVAE